MMHIIRTRIQNNWNLAKKIRIKLTQINCLYLILLQQKLKSRYTSITFNNQITSTRQVTDLYLINWQITISLEALNQILNVLVLITNKQSHCPLNHNSIFNLIIRHSFLIGLMNNTKIIRIKIKIAQANPTHTCRSLGALRFMISRCRVRHFKFPQIQFNT